MKIDKVKIKNFKSLKEIEIPLSNLNLITGVNSIGKSSFIQALLLIKQNEEKFYSLRGSKITNINDIYVQLGNKKDILFEEIFQENIDISIFSDTLTHKLSFNINDLEISNIVLLPDVNEETFNIFYNDFQYLQTDRIVPQISYYLSNEMVNKNLIGFRGEYTAHYLAKNRHKEIISALKHPKSQTAQLLENVSLWLSDISENIEVKAKIFDELQQVDLKYSYVYGDKTTQDYTPLNVGFGITYVLPIIVAILKAKIGDLIIIENPESHLHPKAQSKLAELFALASSIGIQLIIETHSDHILNGIRVAIKKSIIQSKQTQIYYFRKEKDKLETIIDTIKINEQGAIKSYPKHFFDQFDNDLDELLGL
jgi:predicted ATPase